MVESYSELYKTFRWHVPKGFSLAAACCLQWSGLPSHEQRPALIRQDTLGNTRLTTFAELGRMTAQLANGLTRLGVIPGDRVVIVLSNPSDVLVSLLACWAVRAVAVPLPPSSSADVLLPKIKQARSQVALIDGSTQSETLLAISRCPRIKHTIGIDVYDGRVMNWRGLIARQATTHMPMQPLPSDPALMVWPEHTGPDLDPQSAMVLSHQSLIGQLPGFVMAANWFPAHSRQLMTTLMPWDEAGLLAAILPTLYFGQTVLLAPRLPTPANLPSQVTHVVTTAHSLITALKSDTSGQPASNPLSGLALLDHSLHPDWQTQAQQAYGVKPNLSTFISGAGLFIAQSLAKWHEPNHSSGRLVPGHRIRLAGTQAQATDARLTTGQIEISRTDLAQQTDPAQFTQAWPVKDSLDLSAQLPTWWRTNLYAQELEDGCWRVLGYTDQWQTIAGCSISLWQLEQAVLLEPQVKWAQVAFVAARKQQTQMTQKTEVWVVLDTGPTHERHMKPWRLNLRMDMAKRILNAMGLANDQVNIRIGLVDHQAMSRADQVSRCPWQTRAYQALIDFL